jgi:hypothetical protein
MAIKCIECRAVSESSTGEALMFESIMRIHAARLIDQITWNPPLNLLFIHIVLYFYTCEHILHLHLNLINIWQGAWVGHISS